MSCSIYGVKNKWHMGYSNHRHRVANTHSKPLHYETLAAKYTSYLTYHPPRHVMTKPSPTLPAHHHHRRRLRRHLTPSLLPSPPPPPPFHPLHPTLLTAPIHGHQLQMPDRRNAGPNDANASFGPTVSFFLLFLFFY